MNIEHILVATDLSDEALACSAPVGGFARRLGARITLLHVLEGHQAIPHGAPLAPPVGEPPLPGEEEAARAQLEERLPAYGEGVEVRPVLLSGRDAVREILAYAERERVDLIALATHGRTGFQHLIIGSVTEAVVRRSTIPVLVLPRPKN